MPVHGIDNGNNKHAVYTTEELLSILQQAIDSGSLQGIDPEKNPIVAAVRESHNNSDVTFWSGTEAEFNELTGVTSELVGARIGSDGKLYILTGDTTLSDTVEAARQAALEATEGMKREVISVTLLADGWSSTAPYTQTVAVAGMTADKDFLAPYLEPTGNESDDLAAQVALSCISGGTTDTDSVTFYCYDEKPTTTITVFMVDKGTKIESGDYPIATTSTLGVVKVGDGLNVDQAGKLSVAAYQIATYSFDNVAAMVAYNLAEGDTAITAGYYSINDGGGGTYKIVSSGSTADGGSIIALNNGLKAQLLVEGKVNVKQFGAKGDDSTDDTIAMQNAINYAQSKGLSVSVDSGTYQVTGLTVSETLKIIGNGYNSVIKAKSGSSSDVITLTGNGIYKSDISNIFIDGNKENVSATINGIKLEKGTSSAGDKYTIIHDVTIKNLTGCGIYANENTSGNLRELRFNNVDIGSCEDTGLFLQGVTDSYFDTVVCHANTKYGFNINSGPHKMVNCKAFYNGAGDGTTIEDAGRIPASAFTVTSDTSPQSGKTYYTRSGTNQQNDWYVFAEFTGDTFDGETTYYELTTSYYKKYAGFYIHGVGFQLSNCESQENFGDGFRLGGTNYVISSCIADNNGNLATSYASAGLEQLYYGFHGGLWQSTLNFTAKNFRNSSVGKQQKAPALLVGASEVSGSVTGTDQVTSDILFRNCSLASMEFVYNGKPLSYKIDLSSITKDSNTLSINTSYSYIRQQNKVNHLYLVLNDTEGFATSTTNKNLLTLPELFRPAKATIVEGLLSTMSGAWQLSGETCTITIGSGGGITSRANTSSSTSEAKYLVIKCDYPMQGNV